MACKQWSFSNQKTECSYNKLLRHKDFIGVSKSHRTSFASLTQEILK
jgi:hypothetical protein